MVRRRDLNHRNSPRYVTVAGTRVVETVDTVRVTRAETIRRAEEQQQALAAQKPRPISSWTHLALRPPQRPPRRRPSAEVVEPPTRLRRILKSVSLPVPLICKQRRKRRRDQQIMHAAARKLRDAKTVLRAPVITIKTMKFMDALHMPYLPPNCNWSQLKCLLHLNWTIHLENSENSLLRPPPPTIGLGTVLSHPIWPEDTLDTGSYHRRLPALTVPPAHSPAAILNQQFYRRYRRFDRGFIEIPTSWMPIQHLYSYDLRDVPVALRKSPSTGDEIPLMDSPVLGQEQTKSGIEREEAFSKSRDSHSLSVTEPQDGTIIEPQPTLEEQIRTEPPISLPHTTSNSSPSHRHNDNAATPTRSRFENDGDNGSDRSKSTRVLGSLDSDNTSTVTPSTPGSPYRTTTISFTPRLYYQIDGIYEWEMAAVMDPQSFGWKRQDPDILQYRERARHVRSLLSAPNLPNFDINPSRASARFLSSYRRDLGSASEIGLSQLIGRLLGDVMSTGSISAHYSIRKFTPSSWRCPASPVKLDVGFIPTKKSLPWDQRSTPILLAAQFSEDHYGHDRKAAEILACALHPTMMLLILYYLDTRSRVEDSLPPWMIIYGIIFTASGFSIHEYYPDFRPGVAGATSRWTSASRWRLKLEYNIDTPPADRGQSLAALLRISGHTQFVLENLRKWDAYQRIVKSNFLP